MRSSDPSTNHNRPYFYIDWPIIIGKWPVGVLCAYNAQGAERPFNAFTMPYSRTRMPNLALVTSIMCHHARIAGQKRG